MIETQDAELVRANNLIIEDIILFDDKINPIIVESIETDNHRILINKTWHFAHNVGVRIVPRTNVLT